MDPHPVPHIDMGLRRRWPELAEDWPAATLVVLEARGYLFPNREQMTEEELRRELLEMDVELRRKQAFWETPRHIAILLGAVAAIVATVAGLAGYKIGSTPPPSIIINVPPNK